MVNAPVFTNLRVRHLRADFASIELDDDILMLHESILPEIAREICKLGFKNVTFQKYKTGNVAKF
jgi:hypothetical protein